METLLTPKDVQKMLRCSLPWVYKAANKGLLPSIRIPCPGEGTKKRRDMIRFKSEDILNFVERYYKTT
jgi:hypothetical protein